jgi:hypothetical protein
MLLSDFFGNRENIAILVDVLAMRTFLPVKLEAVSALSASWGLMSLGCRFIFAIIFSTLGILV